MRYPLPLVFAVVLVINLLGLARHFGGLFFGPPSRHRILRSFTSSSTPFTIMPSQHALPEFLQRSKSEYLAAIADGTAKDWVVAVGNEAGGKSHSDLEVSSILRLYNVWTQILTLSQAPSDTLGWRTQLRTRAPLP